MAVEKRQRNTRQRQVVLEELRKLASHPTAAELYERARRRLPKISLGTVYRNLDVLVQRGVIRKLETGGSEARFDAIADRHFHVRCIRCGRVDDAHGLPDESVKAVFKDVSSYEIVGVRLDLLGVCLECRRKSTLGYSEMSSGGED